MVEEQQPKEETKIEIIEEERFTETKSISS